MYLEYFRRYFLLLLFLQVLLKIRTAYKTTDAPIVQKLKKNEARPKFTGSYKKKRVVVGSELLLSLLKA